MKFPMFSLHYIFLTLIQTVGFINKDFASSVATLFIT